MKKDKKQQYLDNHSKSLRSDFGEQEKELNIANQKIDDIYEDKSNPIYCVNVTFLITRRPLQKEIKKLQLPYTYKTGLLNEVYCDGDDEKLIKKISDKLNLTSKDIIKIDNINKIKIIGYAIKKKETM